jgi:hypothetical protein
MNNGSRSFEILRLLALNPIAASERNSNDLIGKRLRAGVVHPVVVFDGSIGLAARLHALPRSLRDASAQFIEQDRHSTGINKFLVLTCVMAVFVKLRIASAND